MKSSDYQSQYEKFLNEILRLIQLSSKGVVDRSFPKLDISVDEDLEMMEGVCGEVIFGTYKNETVACKRLQGASNEDESNLIREAAFQTVFHSLVDETMPCDVPQILGYTFIDNKFHIVMQKIDADADDADSATLTDEQREGILYTYCLFFVIASHWGLEHHDAHCMNVIKSKGRQYFIDFGFSRSSADLEESSDFDSFKDLLSELKEGSTSTKLQAVESRTEIFEKRVRNEKLHRSEYAGFYQAVLIELYIEKAPIIATVRSGDGQYLVRSSIARAKDANTITLDGKVDITFEDTAPRIYMYESNHLFDLIVFGQNDDYYYSIIDRLGVTQFSIEDEHKHDELLLSLDCNYPFRLKYFVLPGCSKAGKTGKGQIVAATNPNPLNPNSYRFIFSYDPQEEESVLKRIHAFMGVWQNSTTPQAACGSWLAWE